MPKRWLAILPALGAALVAALLFGTYRWNAGTEELRSRLEAAREPVRPAIVDFAELEGLPPPVQRYFRAALEEGRPMISGVRVRHQGSFHMGNMGEADDQWKPFTSDQRIVTRRPGFDWDARIAIFPGVSVRVHDAYAAGEGILQASLFGWFTLADLRGSGDVAEGELMRFFAEAAWYPTALLPSQGVHWQAVDDRSARATLVDGELSLTLLFTFDEAGLIDSVSAEARGRAVGDEIVPTPWQGRFSGYQEREGMQVPLEGEVAWLLPEGPKTYWRGRITEIAYEWARDSEGALAVAREWERVGSGLAAWPGFEPLGIPLALYTGERTYLFRHPAPPEGFSPLEGGRPDAFTTGGRHPAVTSSSSAEIGGVVTATVLADGPRAARSTTELAATALHEAFHVFQRARHPRWSGNEVDLFLYPTDEARLLARRRLESEALRRALVAADREESACWARLGLRYRSERFAAMDPAFSDYERLTELNEGLATYVELVAAGQSTVEIPASEFPPTAVRDRVYSVGPALAFLLDRFRPGWKEDLEADDSQHLDAMLEATLANDNGTCSFIDSEIAAAEKTAVADVASVVANRKSRRAELENRPGWRLVVEASERQPLWPQGFDPLNVERIEGGLLHTRFLDLGNDAGELRVLDGEGADVQALTEGVGPHPLLNGVRRVTVVGLARPEIENGEARVIVRAAGVEARFESATLGVRGSEVLVRLGRR